MEDYKEKYEMALEGIQEILSSGEDSIKISRLELRLRGFFPELKEDKDEKIRKKLIELFSRNSNKDWGGVTSNEIITWLEKQGKKQFDTDAIKKRARQIGIEASKNYDSSLSRETLCEMAALAMASWLGDLPREITPKFKKGDWVVNPSGSSWHIDSYDKKYYQVSNSDGDRSYFTISNQDEMRLWNIQDAKDGDVLLTTCDNMNEMVFIYQGIEFDTVHCYFLYSKTNNECKTFNSVCSIKSDIHPATIEQKVSLFQKMNIAGYKWNDQNKHLICKLKSEK